MSRTGKTADPPGRTALKSHERKLLKRAKKAARRADPMWSDFLVGAAVLSAGGRVYTGGNFENDSYGMTICAERRDLLPVPVRALTRRWAPGRRRRVCQLRTKSA